MTLDPNDPLYRHVRKLIEDGPPRGSPRSAFVFRELFKAILALIVAVTAFYAPQLIHLVSLIITSKPS